MDPGIEEQPRPARPGRLFQFGRVLDDIKRRRVQADERQKNHGPDGLPPGTVVITARQLSGAALLEHLHGNRPRARRHNTQHGLRVRRPAEHRRQVAKRIGQPGPDPDTTAQSPAPDFPAEQAAEPDGHHARARAGQGGTKKKQGRGPGRPGESGGRGRNHKPRHHLPSAMVFVKPSRHEHPAPNPRHPHHRQDRPQQGAVCPQRLQGFQKTKLGEDQEIDIGRCDGDRGRHLTALRGVKFFLQHLFAIGWKIQRRRGWGWLGQTWLRWSLPGGVATGMKKILAPARFPGLLRRLDLPMIRNHHHHHG